jgi:hypothetical protein
MAASDPSPSPRNSRRLAFSPTRTAAAGSKYVGGRAAEVGLEPSRAGILDGYRDVLAVLGRADGAEVLSQRRISRRRDRGQLDIDRQRLNQWRT